MAPNSNARAPIVPERERQSHAAALRANLRQINERLLLAKQQQRAADWVDGFGLTVRFSSFPDVALALDRLDLKSHGIELLGARDEGGVMLASVWVPDGKLSVFENKIAEYLERRTDARGRPRDSRALIDAIQEIRTAAVDDLWVADESVPDDDAVRDFEAWLSLSGALVPLESGDIGGGRSRRAVSTPADVRVSRFRAAAESAGLVVSSDELRFPEHVVLNVRGTFSQWRSSAHLLGQLAELRPAPEPPTFFVGLPPEEQRDWVADLLSRTSLPAPGSAVPHVCILDTGGYVAHPLLAPALSLVDLHTVESSWGVDDQHGHGTQQAGLALWGDLAQALASQNSVTLAHRLESVKLLNANNSNHGRHYGSLTRDAVSLPEISFPRRSRVFSMAITAEPALLGKPSAWSAEVDALASDWAGGGEAPRLFVVSGGNVLPQHRQYPMRNELTSIEDPAQAWNAITVGALTHKASVDESASESYEIVADSGGLSPHSATSGMWDRESPLKPEVVFEGGNCAEDWSLVTALDSLSLLTTSNAAPRLLDTSCGTSAAAALASNFAANLMASYPDYWPETVRALMVHSARWTPTLLEQFARDGSKESIEQLIRRCGWGEPDLDQALHSGADSLFLIVQQSIQPFAKADSGSIRSNEMQLHALPWPKQLLQELGSLDVEVRVTLSYFVEPSPGERGRGSRYAYASHGLRFALQKPLESVSDFNRRINQLVQDEDSGVSPRVTSGDQDWLLGFRRRFRGSLHHDRWTGRAVELANREHIAVFPTGGWWKSRPAHGRYTRDARYALVVSLHAPSAPVSVDLYAAIEGVLATSGVQVAVPGE